MVITGPISGLLRCVRCEATFSTQKSLLSAITEKIIRDGIKEGGKGPMYYVSGDLSASLRLEVQLRRTFRMVIRLPTAHTHLS